jgi:proline dehydrogenase
VLAHYQETLVRITTMGIRGEVSIKPTQLGYDFDPELCTRHARALAEAARVMPAGFGSTWRGATTPTPRSSSIAPLRETHANVGVCLQAYLRRTRADLESLLPMGPAIRIVKGAYAEPPDKAFPDKRDVDDNFHWMVEQLWKPGPRANGAWATIGTHDRNLINEMELLAKRMGVGAKDYEYALLYGIQRGEQLRLVKGGHNVRVLISYGSHWFPWYMRRLAERPANLLFVAKSMFAS